MSALGPSLSHLEAWLDLRDSWKIGVVVQENQVVLDRQLRDQAIDAASWGEPRPSAPCIKEACFSVCRELVPWRHAALRAQPPQKTVILRLIAGALEEFLDDDTGDKDRGIGFDQIA